MAVPLLNGAVFIEIRFVFNKFLAVSEVSNDASIRPYTMGHQAKIR